MTYSESQAIAAIFNAAQTIVVLQADNPDADSLGSALALESLLGGLGKDVHLYCGVDIPEYLRYLPGWDRVEKDLPPRFDASVIVDASTYTLLEKVQADPAWNQLRSKPSVVLDHHANVEQPINFSAVTICDDSVASTGELLYHLSSDLGWKPAAEACDFMVASILGDTQGLMNDLAKPRTYRVMADLMELGADRPALEEKRREYSKMPADILAYKGRLLERVAYAADGRIAYVSIPQEEINTYSPLYNPGPLVQYDMLQVIGVQLTIVFKTYDDGRITASLRSVSGYGVAGDLATAMGGGGHAYASGFKHTEGRPFSEIQAEALAKGRELLDALVRPELAK